MKDLLASIRNQPLGAISQVVIVDSSSEDHTVITAKKFGAEVKIIPTSEFNHGGTRNLGASHATGDFIFFFTQDALIHSDNYFLTLIESIERHQAAGGYARQIPRADATLLVRRDLESWLSGKSERRVLNAGYANEFFSLHPIDRYFRSVFDNVASVIRREVWEKNPFPYVPFGEDMEWAYRALCNGYTVLYEPDAVVMHSHERSADYLYKRTFIDHYRLYELFGVRTIPDRRRLLQSVIKTVYSDARFLSRHHVPVDWLHLFRYAWASAFGQYDGAKAAARGIPAYQSRDV